MKNFYMLMITLLLGAGAFAQVKNEQTLKLRKPVSVPSVPYNTSRGVTNGIWLDYDSADAYIFGVSQAEFIWIMNERYSVAAGDTNYNMQNCIVRFDSLYDIITNTTIDNATVTNITVDSIYALIGHANVSGENDTLVTKIISLNGQHYPNTSSILWSNTMITDTSWSSSGNWLETTYLQWNPNYSLATNVSGFAVELDYYDPSKLDTCGFLAGFQDQGACATASQSAMLGNFYPNSYVGWTSYLSQYPLIPDASGFDIYYDCNENGKKDAGDGENYIQDVLIGAWITVTTGNIPTCGANFTISADSAQLHHYIVTNNAFGTGPLNYDWSWGDGAHDAIPLPTHTYADSGFYNICLTITDSTGCTSTFCDSDFHAMRNTNSMVYMTVVKPIITGTQELNAQTLQVNIYPNPATDKLYINSSGLTGNSTITIYNLLGETIYTMDTNRKQETVNCKPFPSGIYFLQMKTESGVVTKKFVKE